MSPLVARYWDHLQCFTEEAIDYFGKTDPDTRGTRESWLQAFYIVLHYSIHLHNNWNNEEIAKEKTISYVGEARFLDTTSLIPIQKENPQFYFIHTLVVSFWKHINHPSTTLQSHSGFTRKEFTYAVATDFAIIVLNEVIHYFEEGVRVRDKLYFMNSTEFPELWEIIQDWTSSTGKRRPKKLLKLFYVRTIYGGDQGGSFRQTAKTT